MKRKFSFNYIIVGILFLILIICSALISMSVLIIKNNINYVSDSISQTLSIEVKKIEDGINKNLLLLENFASEMQNEIIDNPALAVRWFEEDRKKHNLRNLSFASLDGTTYTFDNNQVNLSSRTYFQDCIKGEKCVSNLVSSKNDGFHVNVFAVPVWRYNEVVGVLWASVLYDSFYELLKLDHLETFGEVYVINQEGYLISEKEYHNDGDNFFEFIESQDIKNINNINNMKDDFSNGESGYVEFKYLNSKNDNIGIYYNPMEINDWWILIKVPHSVLWESSKPQIVTVVSISTTLLIFSVLVFLIIFKKTKHLKKDVIIAEWTDQLTGGYNDMYLKNYIAKEWKDNELRAFISFEIVNITKLIKVLGISRVEEMVVTFYQKLESSLMPGDVLVRSSLSEFNLFKIYNNINGLTLYLNHVKTLCYKLDFIMGVYEVEPGVKDYDVLIARAIAAKSNLEFNKNYGIYSKAIHTNEIVKVDLENKIQLAIENNEFKAWYQPKYNQEGKIIGSEALVRWYSKDGIISPYHFVPICEANGTIDKIDCQVLECVCKMLQKQLQKGMDVVPISINLSRKYLNDTSFINNIENVLTFYQIPHHLIQFEITESYMEENEAKLKEVTAILHAKGFKLLLDDFGVGYSSIKTIADLKFDIIKLDKSFIDDITSEKGKSIVNYTIKLAKQLGAQVVAEGVEEKEQFAVLKDLDCDFYQGYYFAKPMDESTYLEQFNKK